MLHFDKALTRLAANALRGRIRSNQFRVLSFDFLELLHEPVKLGIRNLRRVKHVIKVLMAADVIAQAGISGAFDILELRQRSHHDELAHLLFSGELLERLLRLVVSLL